jgi:3-hydroxyisobutyrate dehydrogenase-like beta-hydroxyacid dehydrogenase
MTMTTPVKRTGMIGLGAMGLQMARHMKIRASRDITVAIKPIHLAMR